MLAYHVTEAQARTAAISVGVDIQQWRSVTRTASRFRLRLAPCACPASLHGHRRDCRRKYQRTSAGWGRHGRLVAAVCWHGHRDFFRMLLTLAPAARVQTTQLRHNPPGERFYTRDTFLARYPRTGQRNVGPPVDPIAYQDCCTCDEHTVTFGTLTPDRGLVDVRLIRQADLLRCPFAILAVEHYREDGSCRCDDPIHRAMMIREWGYSDADFASVPLRKDGSA